ncbi:MAG: HupE/UreJ family protein [Rhizobiaceae bacterium]|nr:HupE/UreJ family protein [Rhizobiaceae bacterium]
MTIRHLILAVFCLFISGLPAESHTRSQSSSIWNVDGSQVTMTFFVDTYRATLLAAFGWDALSPEQMLARHLPETITVQQAGIACPIIDTQTGPGVKGTLRSEAIFQCPSDAIEVPADIEIGAFFALSATHQHIFQARLKDGTMIERILTEGHNGVRLAPHADDFDFLDLLTLGFEHVLSGLDHILFLIALVLMCQNWRQILTAVTCFTAGHMLALYLVVTGTISPVPIVMEVLIGLSIAALAVAALARTQPLPTIAPFLVSAIFVSGGLALAGFDRLPVSWITFVALSIFIFLDLTSHTRIRINNWPETIVITLLFSLAHGAGFAGGLLQADFRQSALLYSLLFFNLGVELGQLAIVAVTIALLAIIAKRTNPAFVARSQRLLTQMLIWAGSYYFFLRLV